MVEILWKHPEEYINKIEEKLKDKDVYEEVKDPTNIIKKKITTLTKRLFKFDRINQKMKNEFSSIDDLPRIRGQPKIHKKDHPMRIITNTKNTILSPISAYAFSFIRQLRETIEHTICNTSKFIKEISKAKIDNDDNLTSNARLRTRSALSRRNHVSELSANYLF